MLLSFVYTLTGSIGKQFTEQIKPCSNNYRDRNQLAKLENNIIRLMLYHSIDVITLIS
jgi:transcription termination factor NusB